MLLLDLDKKYTAYKITAEDGELRHICVVDKECSISPAHAGRGKVYIEILRQDNDQDKVIDVAMKYCNDAGRTDIKERIIYSLGGESRKPPAAQIKCIDTGELFDSAIIAAREHNLTYGALLKHLKGEKSYNSVKGKTYKKVRYV